MANSKGEEKMVIKNKELRQTATIKVVCEACDHRYTLSQEVKSQASYFVNSPEDSKKAPEELSNRLKKAIERDRKSFSNSKLC